MAKSIATLLKDAGARLEQYDFGSALQLYGQAIAQEPQNAAAAMGMAMVFNRTGKPAEALALLERIWTAMAAARPKATPVQQAAILAQVGLAKEQLGRLGEALETYQQAGRLVRSPDLERRVKQLEPLVGSSAPVQQLILNARRLQANGQLEEAVRTFRAALQLQPDSAEVLHGLALVLRALKAPAEAMPLLQKAVILAPERAEYYNDLGLLFQDRADFAKAISFHKRALKVDPMFTFAWINLGVAYKRLGKMQESEEAYRKALEVDPRLPQAHNNLGNLLRVTGRLEDARRHLRRALALQPQYRDAQENLAAVAQDLAARKAKEAAKTAAPARKAAKAPARRAAAR